jgi:hypothetical protein
MVLKDNFCIEGIEKKEIIGQYSFFVKSKIFWKKIRKNHHMAYS